MTLRIVLALFLSGLIASAQEGAQPAEHAAKVQRELIEWLKDSGAEVSGFGSGLFIDFTDVDFDADDIRRLERLTAIESLSLIGESVDDEMLRTVAKIKDLQRLALTDTAVSDGVFGTSLHCPGCERFQLRKLR